MPSRRSFAAILSVVATLVTIAATCPRDARADSPRRDTLVYISATGGRQGIYLFRLQTENLEVSQNITLVPLGLAAETAGPSFLEIDATRRFLFVANAVDELDGKPTGGVSSYAIDPETGKLSPINQRPSMGRRPCALALDRGQRQLLVANCGSGTVAVLPVGADGRLGEATQVTAAADTSGAEKAGAPAAADVAQAHCLTFDPANRFAFTCDFGSHVVRGYQFDAARGSLTPSAPPAAAVREGRGPQDMVFRPDGRFAYVASALSSTISVMAYDVRTGTLEAVQTVSSVPPYFDGRNAAAELAVHPSGKYLYVSNRGHNSVTLFGIAPDTGLLTYIEEQGTGGVNPVHFGVEPSARHLAIANQGSDTVLVCRIDAGNGRLKPSGVFASVPSPVFVTFLPPPGADR
jgi:6-phosphogluconolactonase